MKWSDIFKRKKIVADTPDLKELIDKRNQYFWESINKEYSINVCYHNHDYHMVYSEGITATIFIPYTGYSIEGFTHEVLHLYLKMCDLNVGNMVYVLMKCNPTLNNFDSDLIEHIGNTIDHALMFTLYSKAGFKEELFLFDYHTPKCTDHEMDLIQQGLGIDIGYIRKISIEAYIGKFFGMKACTNKQYNYAGYFFQLQQISPSLYAVLEALWYNIAGFNIQTKEEKGRVLIAVSFIDTLLEWIASDPVAEVLK